MSDTDTPDGKRRKTDEEQPRLEPNIVLNEKQQYVVDMVRKKKHIFLTGSAGVGKSSTLKELIKHVLPEMYEDRFCVAGSTGVASVQINAVTLNSLFSIHQNMITSGNVIPSAAWRDIDALVIDEISMVHPDMFLHLNKQAQQSRKSGDEPFGGVQLIVVGDFFQLPPVHKGAKVEIEFVFQLPLWRQLFHGKQGKIIELNQVFRQADRQFVARLERIRRGKVNMSDNEAFANCKSRGDHQLAYTKLFGLREKVQNMNARELAQLSGTPKSFKMHFIWEPLPGGKAFSSREKEMLSKQAMTNLPVGEMLTLKINAQVMMVANVCVKAGLANGSRGVVVDFDQTTEFPIVQFDKVKVLVRPYDWPIVVGKRGKMIVRCVPLTLAYAITIHKSQGQTIDGLDVDMAGLWEAGQGYTALSRARSMENLIVRNFSASSIKTNPKVVQYYSEFEKDKIK
jgi:ATP-dependent DNA helicase PIF1